MENPGDEGLARVPLAVGRETVNRSVWIDGGESAEVRFMNLIAPEGGDVELQAGYRAATLAVAPKPAGQPVGEPYQTFKNVESTIKRIEGGFYIRAGGQSHLLDLADEYGAVYRDGGLGADGTIIVRIENPDNLGNWSGHAGIMVRNDITGAGKSSGYVILASSPGNGSSLQWDSDGDGVIDEHTELDGHTRWPHWLKLVRKGPHFASYSSVDGSVWQAIGEADVPGDANARDAGLFCHRSSARFSQLEWK